MTKRMLIDAAHPEETRVVIVDSNRVEELDFESRNKRQLRGNVYLARVTRVEPSLQAAFIEYGGNRHGFLAFSEIHPDYYKIPEADKLALKEQEEEDQRQADEDEEKRKAASARRKSRTKRDEDESDDFEDDSDEMDSDEEDEDEDERDENVDPDDDDATDETDAEVADEQVNVASKRRKRISRRRYKIQEVIKRGQILLVQAVKEERGNKGAAMTTYLSLAGRYCVLMPNTPRGGGISRKISNGSDRKRLKSIMNNLEVPQGMGVIVRTAGAKRTKSEIGHDYDYLSRLWSDIRNTTMESSAPALIHEEGNLVKRSIRDLYNKDIEEILVQGKDAHKTASDFINMLMPSHAKFVKHYDDQIPLFLRYGAEKQIENSLDATVQLKSGGYLVIHPTEALISVDVNSGRSTKERNIERTALKTNMEAAEELARQMRLRDLAGLIVVDFIDMDEHKNNRAVERKMKEMLAKDRARIQTSRISQFGLMEISRQRRRRSLLEGSTTSCPHCSGVGRKRTIESSALAAIRAVEEFAVRGKAKRIRLKTSHDVALYLLNEKRDLLTQVDDIADVFTEVVGSDDLIRPHFELEVVEKREDKRSDPLIQIERDFKKEREAAKRKPKAARSEKSKDESDETENTSPEDESDEENRKSGRRRSRRGRRGGRGRGRKDESPQNEDSSEAESVEETSSETETEAKPKAKRGRRRAPAKGKAESTKSEETKSEDAKSNESAGKGGRRRRAPSKSKDKPVEAVAETVEKVEPESPKRRSTTRRKAPSRNKEAATETSDTSKRTRKAPAKKAPAKKAEEPSETEAKKPTRKRRAPAKKTTEAAKSKPEAKTTRTRKAPVKKPAAEETEAPKPARKRRAPAKKKAEAKVDAADTEKKPARTRKAPAKKAEPAETKAPTKKAVKKKAPAKKAVAKASAAEAVETEVKPKRTRKAPVKKATATKKATAKKAAPKAANPAEAKAAPKRTRKAPTKAPAAPASVPAPKAEATQAAEAPKTTEKKSKGGWWKRRKKD
ncbi:MAG: Rne/Rng family ribonuclease [Litorimonas sp.]